jgi:hypothetical protein
MSHYHDDGIARDPAGGLNHIGHHGFSKNLMQHLGLARLHAFAESCGQYDDRKAPIHEFSFQQCGAKKTKGQIRAWIALWENGVSVTSANDSLNAVSGVQRF